MYIKCHTMGIKTASSASMGIKKKYFVIVNFSKYSIMILSGSGETAPSC